ncbi:2,3,4,5-tetrahydropyridine-2,6-dicarboxylate N-succinyltransferase, partial [bacterium I07]
MCLNQKHKGPVLDLKIEIEAAFDASADGHILQSYHHVFNEFIDKLNTGEIRAAEPVHGEWKVNIWVKKGILLGFRIGTLMDYSIPSAFPFFDKSTFPLKPLSMDDGVRIVPGGSSVRNGVYLGKQVTCMPPMYINAGAYVDDGAMIDSHALVGSCAQIGKQCHISAGSQIGGVLEPIGSVPVIIEDHVLVGGNCGLYEGVVVQSGAIIGAGTILTGGTPVYDIVNDCIYRKTPEKPLIIPKNAVVVPGSRPLKRQHGLGENLSLYTPVIV